MPITPLPEQDDLPIAITSALLDGRQGLNRAAPQHRQISAETDLEAVRLWLAEYHDSPHTLRSYRKEAIRLLIWATEYCGKAMSSLTREDFLIYEKFLANPSLDWVDPNRPRHGNDRRLFVGPLSAPSRRQSMGIVSGLFSYLVAAGYLAANPLALRRRSGKTSLGRAQTIERYLDQALWQAVLNFIETMPKHTQRQNQHYERVRWLFRLLYAASLRVSEAAQAKTADLVQRRGNWWLKVLGKGGVQGDVPISLELMADLARYRQFNGLSPTPTVDEQTPLILSITGRTEQFLTPTAVYLMVKTVFRDAAAAMSVTEPDKAAILLKASTHWLRHTSASHQADAGNDIRNIQKNLRHASIETTAIYLHVEDDKRHAETTGNKSIK